MRLCISLLNISTIKKEPRDIQGNTCLNNWRISIFQKGTESGVRKRIHVVNITYFCHLADHFKEGVMYCYQETLTIPGQGGGNFH